MKNLHFNFIFVCLIALAIANDGLAQGYDTIHGFTLCVSSSPAIDKILNEVTTMADSCPYFSSLQKDYYVLLILTPERCESKVFSQNLTSIYYYKNQLPLKKQAICYYNGHIIHIQDYSGQNLLNKYFTVNGEIIDLIFKKNDNYFEHIIPANLHFDFYYENIDGGFIRDTSEDSYLFEEWCGLNNRMEFNYMVQTGDTWASIAKKMGCTEEQLRKEYIELDMPIPGTVIFLIYTFDNDGNFIGPKRMGY